ncbi:uncharacterized protein N7506_005119 [Penicillium brevicompactum]|uniref:uncharacterized protein n=1 Tax=Penicillium brevicompactum TaxID=5074 RepID=UPI00254063BD|nr:uncharacterized protein N7506_005119 [Penicillium brevicompactum]KAJ5337097.1 hypothetical protein N7506_005119 [Penicillium brevicompactum]
MGSQHVAQYVKGLSVVDLTKLRSHQDTKPEHLPVTWNARVYLEGRKIPDNGDFGSRKPDLTYIDDRPIELSVGAPPTQQPTEPENNVTGPVEWSGAVIVIDTFVEAGIQTDSSSAMTGSPRLDMLNPTRVSTRCLVVGSPFLAHALGYLVQYYPSFHGMLFDESMREGLIIQEPFAVLLHHFDSIEAMAEGNAPVPTCKSEHDDSTESIERTKDHLQHLVDFLRPIYQELMLTYQKHISDPVPQVAFDKIWYLLKPGTDVYVQVDGSIYVAVVIDVKPDGANHNKVVGSGNVKWWLVDLWQLETDGSRLRRGLISAKVRAYSGLREVTSLSVCPISIWDAQDAGERRRHIIRRSAILFKALRQGNLLADYNGPIKETAQEYVGKVVIDHWRGLTDPKRQRPNSSHVKDYSNRFQEYDGTLINKDRPFNTIPSADNTENGEDALSAAEAAKDEQIARLEKLISDDRSEREAKETARLQVLGITALEQQHASHNQPTDPAQHETIARLENRFLDRHSERAAKGVARLAAIQREATEKAAQEQELAHDRTGNSGQHYAKPEGDSAGISPTKVHEYQGTELPDMEPRVHVTHKLTEHQLLLLCPVALAFALGTKQWILISLDYIQESVPSDEIISNLIIGPGELQIIKALSNRQNSHVKHWSVDFIEGKGSGQIILLHGPPGVGKTYTVEAISEWLHRPLLTLTVADIGTVETLVEENLVHWFNLAETWNAVLLVDEADVFLERRQNRDLARNGLVSAFLRRMEYFKGLLFLTTNRVGQIDDAFISRIHIAIEYQKLNEETRRKVWNGFFRKLKADRTSKIQIELGAKKWILDTAGETQLNGRDIRNALQTAITLAEFEKQEDPEDDEFQVTVVTTAHFQKVLGMVNQFRN